MPNPAKYAQLVNPGAVYGDNFLINQDSSNPLGARTGTVTRGKRKAVKYIIKVL
jgi:hypothetical protein